MGGSVGLKGTDGKQILEKALELGAIPTAELRAFEFLKNLNSIKSKLHFITCPLYMGENVLKKLEFEYSLVENPIFDKISSIKDSSSIHTEIAAKSMLNIGSVKLIVFVGGDGTARDMLRGINRDIPCLGVPAGVKIYSSAFATNPSQAASLVMQFLWEEIPMKESEILDIDEEQYRRNILDSKLYGYVLTPYSPDYMQLSKMGSPDTDLDNQERIAQKVIEELDDNYYYLLGPGTTIKAISDALNLPKSVLGVDLIHKDELVAKDLNEKKILGYLQKYPTKLVISPIGRQGFLFGRGNLQLSPKVLKTLGIENIIIVATRFKLNQLPQRSLKVDTRDHELDSSLRGFYKVIVDYDEYRICKVE